MKTLVIYASPVKAEASYSTRVTKKYIKEIEGEIIELDLNKDARFNTNLNSDNIVDMKFFNDGVSDEMIKQLFEIDQLIIATAMINFNVPAVLKNFLDKICVANKTFKYKYDGNGESEGLLTNLKVKVIASQGAPKGWYPFGDHVAYLEGVFNFLGAKVEPSILIDGTKTKEFDESKWV